MSASAGALHRRCARSPRVVSVPVPLSKYPAGSLSTRAVADAVGRLLDNFLVQHGLLPFPVAELQRAPRPSRAAQGVLAAAAQLRSACLSSRFRVQRVLFLAGESKSRPLAAMLVDLGALRLSSGTPPSAAAPSAAASTEAEDALCDAFARQAMLALFLSDSEAGAVAAEELPARTKFHVVVCAHQAATPHLAEAGWGALCGGGYDAGAPAQDTPFDACREQPVVVRFCPCSSATAAAVPICCDFPTETQSPADSTEQTAAAAAAADAHTPLVWWQVPGPLRGFSADRP